MNIFGEFFEAVDGVFNFFPNLRSRRKPGIAEPIMANHSLFGGISDCPRFQLPHRGKRLVDLRLRSLEKILRKFHPADVEREIEIAIVQKISLETLPERRRSHDAANRSQWRRSMMRQE